MLKSNESITITGESKIGDKVVVSMVASITTDGGNYPNSSNTVLDKELYAANIEACQADIAAFNTKVFEKQKQILGGTK
ncbi:hypothetical protein [Clostridium cadaveris]|uniref:Uncharacterized protein n=2 Tax=Clostridium cadaveris TaxID=1529 RepID=A0A316MC90_9CLOT|nr:hypothetical protein [Clostridium cadaveris]PWL55418.1 MAG: hypothetical protein DBY38_01475 [Clostridium cadaveris]